MYLKLEPQLGNLTRCIIGFRGTFVSHVLLSLPIHKCKIAETNGLDISYERDDNHDNTIDIFSPGLRNYLFM